VKSYFTYRQNESLPIFFLYIFGFIFIKFGTDVHENLLSDFSFIEISLTKAILSLRTFQIYYPIWVKFGAHHAVENL
jgi:hypothetical protein